MKLSFIGVGVLALATYAPLAAAQTSRPVPVQRQMAPATPPAQPAAQPPAKAAPVKRAMPQPGTEDTPVLTTLRVKPITIYNMLRRPYVATTAEGQLVFIYDGQILVEERIIGPDIVGKYTYAPDGRFERIDYSDGVSVTATYGHAGQLARLTSNSGRSIDFAYQADKDGAISVVSPTNNALQFHSALALLRLRQAPDWWHTPAPAMDRLMQDDGKGTPAVPSGSGWDGAPEYPYDPFPQAPRTPEGVPSIGVSAPRLPPEHDPNPLPRQPVQGGGVDIIPVGGPGGRSPLPYNPGMIRDLDEFATFKDKQQICHIQCADYQQTVDQICKSGPNFRAIDQCWLRSARFYRRCVNACDKGDFDHDFQYTMPPGDRIFFPWLNAKMTPL